MGQYLKLAQQVQQPFTEIRQPISVPSEPISTAAQKPDAVRQVSTPKEHCPACGGGYWIRSTLKTRWQCGRCYPSESRVETVLLPGGTVPRDAALFASAPATKGIKIQPAALNAKPVYWETGTGRILGPSVPEFLAQDGKTFWVVTTFEEQVLWINAGRLRSRQAFERQAKSKVFELVKEPR